MAYIHTLFQSNIFQARNTKKSGTFYEIPSPESSDSKDSTLVSNNTSQYSVYEYRLTF